MASKTRKVNIVVPITLTQVIEAVTYLINDSPDIPREHLSVYQADVFERAANRIRRELGVGDAG